ncbi:MAG: DUF6665 family protein [Maricaulaceae bacterium]
MTFRLPKNLTSQLQTETGASELEAAILGEHAAAIGDHGRRVEKAMAEWGSRDVKDKIESERLLENAVEVVYNFLIQREALGINNHDHAIKFYKITGPILARLGTRGRT